MVVHLTQQTTMHMAGENKHSQPRYGIQRILSEEWHLLSLCLAVSMQPVLLILLGQTPSIQHGHRFQNFRAFIFSFIRSFIQLALKV